MFCFLLAKASVDRFKQILQDYKTAASTIETLEQAKSLDMMKGSITLSQAWNGFMEFTRTLYTPVTKTVTGQSGRTCLYPYGSTDFAESPCCNRSLANTQCCVSTDVSIPYESFGTITVSADQCYNPESVESVVVDFLQANEYNKLATSATLDSDSTGQTLRQFMQQCQTEFMTETACTQDSQCSYRRTCNLQMSMCQYNWAEPAESLAACYVDKMDSRMLDQMVYLWKLGKNFTALRTVKSTLKSFV